VFGWPEADGGLVEAPEACRMPAGMAGPPAAIGRSGHPGRGETGGHRGPGGGRTD